MTVPVPRIRPARRPYLTPQNQRRFDALTLLDSVDFVHDLLLPRLTVSRTVASVALHPVCSLHHAGSEDKLRAIAAAIAEEVFVRHPQAAAASPATAAPAPRTHCLRHRANGRRTRRAQCTAYLSSNRTCEIGMQRGTGQPYRSFIFLLEELTR